MDDAEAGDAAEKRVPIGVVTAAHALGLVILILGLMGFFVGAMLSSLCFIAEGVLCSGTGIGGMGATAMLLGGPPLLVGLALVLGTRKRLRAASQVRLARAFGTPRPLAARELSAELSLARARIAPVGAPGPVASSCPKCQGPVKPGASECEWCGQPFVT